MGTCDGHFFGVHDDLHWRDILEMFCPPVPNLNSILGNRALSAYNAAVDGCRMQRCAILRIKNVVCEVGPQTSSYA